MTFVVTVRKSSQITMASYRGKRFDLYLKGLKNKGYGVQNIMVFDEAYRKTAEAI